MRFRDTETHKERDTNRERHSETQTERDTQRHKQRETLRVTKSNKRHRETPSDTRSELP